MTVAAAPPESALGSPHPDGWLRLSWSQLNWLLRLVELPGVLVAVTLGHPTAHLGALVGLLSVAAVAWVGWLVVWPWRTDPAAGGRTELALLLLIAASSGLAAMIGGAGNAAILAIVVAIQAGASLDPVRAVGVSLTGAAGVAVGSAVFGHSSAGIYVAYYTAVLGAVTLAGVVRGVHREQLRQARLLLAQEQQTRAEQEHTAALAERARIAREIHDILAHSLADLSIQLEVAAALLTDGADQNGALQRVRHAHRLAGEGMEETRRAVHALRSDAPPLPDALAAMAGAYGGPGGGARFEVEGTLRPLPAAASLALIRAAQESLVNARKHAAGVPVSLRLRYGAERVHLTIADVHEPAGGDDKAPPQAPNCDRTENGYGGYGGYGLAGMRERLRLVGGSLAAGPVPGGWVVDAEVPG